MSADPQKPRKILVVHGVQIGSNDDLHQDTLIKELVLSRIGNIPLTFECELFRYEDINDNALKKYNNLISLLVQNPIGAAVGKEALDLVGDVVISLENGSCAHKIREKLKDKILEIYKTGNPCYVVAHSLGSIYTFDVLNALIGENGLFNRASRKTWPIQGLITIGSPIGLDMFHNSREEVKSFGLGDKWFRWLNIWDPNDPVVSGDIFGNYLVGNRIAEKYISGDINQGWVIRDIVTDTGKAWLMAHTAYWHVAVVGDKIVDLVTA